MEQVKADKLKKLLALSSSDNDNEALIAIRQANKILNESNKSWSDVIELNLPEINQRHTNLVFMYNALANKYNALIGQLTVRFAPQSRPMSRKKFNRY